MPSNAEILAQLEKLAEARRPQCVPALNAADEDGDTYCRHCGIGMYVGERRRCQSQPNPIVPILAAVKRWMKIEEAARSVEEWMQERKEWLINNERYEEAAGMRDRQHPLWVALKEPA